MTAGEIAGGAAVLVLRDGVAIADRAVDLLVRALGDPGIGVAGPRLLYDDGTLYAAALAFPEGDDLPWRLHAHLAATTPDANVARDVAALDGAALVVRRGLWEELGGFDAAAGAWADVDFALRAWSLGARVRYEPAAIASVPGGDEDARALDAAGRSHVAGGRREALRYLPRLTVPPAPALALLVERRAAGLEALAFDAWSAALRRDAGARVAVVREKSDLVRTHALAALDRRGVLDVAWRPSRTRADIALAAPLDERDAAVAARAEVAAFWTPAPLGRGRLIGAGIEPERVHVVPIALDEATFAPGDRTRPLLVSTVGGPNDPHAATLARLAQRARSGVAITVLVDERHHEAIRARLPRTVEVVALGADAGALRAAFAAARVFLAPPDPDPFDLLAPAARAAGCVVVDDPDDALARTRETPGTAEATPRGARSRRGAARARELARAHAHGPLDGARAAIDARTAAYLRDAARR